MTRFDGRVAVVTGASRGIGYEVARRLVAEGARVCLTGRDPHRLAKAVTALGGPARVTGVAGRAEEVGHQRAALEHTLSEFGRLHMLVNNTGINSNGSATKWFPTLSG